MSGHALIIGAGCVGRVFGHKLAQGGMRVSYFVRPQYRADTQAGFTLIPLNGLRHAPVRVARAHASSSFHELARERFDVAYITVASHALAGPWLGELVQALGAATVVALQPSRDDLRSVALAGVPRDRLVAGSIGFVAYDAPLPGEAREAGTAFWFPPLARSMFSGPDDAVSSVVRALRAGGLPATRVRDVHRVMAYPTALGMTYLVALERAGWSIASLHGSALLDLCVQAMREMVDIVAHREGFVPPGVHALCHASALRAALAAGTRLAPFPLEPYLQKHFTKVSEQTRLIVRRHEAHGRAAGVRTQSLAALLHDTRHFFRTSPRVR